MYEGYSMGSGLCSAWCVSLPEEYQEGWYNYKTPILHLVGDGFESRARY
jgi:hypothetical protein